MAGNAFAGSIVAATLLSVLLHMTPKQLEHAKAVAKAAAEVPVVEMGTMEVDDEEARVKAIVGSG